MRHIIAYTLCDAFPEEMHEVVARAIKEGWEPIGGPVFQSDRMYQSVVKYAITTGVRMGRKQKGGKNDR